MRKEPSGIPTLFQDNQEYNNSKSKARILNTYFESVFTTEDLSNVATLEVSIYFSLAPISFTSEGIAKILSNLHSNKVSGPDKVHPFILKHFPMK